MQYGYTPRGPIDSAIPKPPPGGTGASGSLHVHPVDWQQVYYETLITILETEDIPAQVRLHFRQRHKMITQRIATLCV